MITRHGNAFSRFYRSLSRCVLCGIKKSVSDADDRVSAFHLSPKAEIWYRLVQEHVLKEDSAAELAVRLKIAQLARSQDPSLVPAYYREVTKKTEDQVLQAYIDGDIALRRRIQRAREGAKPVLDTLDKALLVYRELWLKQERLPKFEQVQELVEERMKSVNYKGRLDPVTWARVRKVMAPLFAD